MIKQLISSIIECEKALENIRIELNQQSLFSLKPIMERFDQQNKGHITSYDILQFCQDNDIQCQHYDAFLCVKYFDVNKDGRVTFEDFTIQMLSKTNREIRFVAAVREPYFIEKQMCLPEIIETGLSYFFGELLIYVREQLEIKMLLEKENFNYFKLFQQLDKSNNGIIHMNDFQKYFNLSQEDTNYFFMMGNLNETIDQINLLDIFVITQLKSENINQERQQSPLKQNKFQQSMDENDNSFQSPEQRSTVKYKKAQLKLLNSEQTHSNASSIFVDELTKKLQDFTFTPKSNDKFQIELINFDKVVYQQLYQLLLKCKLLSKTQLKLIQRSDFCCKAIFKLFDYENRDFITEQDFYSGFRRQRMQIKGLARDLILSYGQDSKINYQQFKRLIYIDQQMDSSESQQTNSQLLSNVTIDYIRQLFQEQIDIEQFKKAYIQNILKKVKTTDDSIVITKQVQDLFNKYNAFPNDRELAILTNQLQILQF
ncbi:unnamed protein product (macronuclear) [Paramecium tetraurelia]|uniref:EF-hand domain-containing protein n=1 Tax=Paramecium tetraurelia TaxID=5888 RepID=A0EDD6_PARTE|nr:uncharacterized protein GSPATT00004172001 [Paramecium tetraurelia]CAK93303.1 unnamed protein product [Paramecium tetraurelia]|eukprot:XP_001460700.1 hypothetical protein (macronuclear) [Paramecium tetraurelia strain d4-2]